jgi:hypothetical protein
VRATDSGGLDLSSTAGYYPTFGEFDMRAFQNPRISPSQHNPVVGFWEGGIPGFSLKNAKARVSGGAALAPSEPNRVYMGRCNDYRDREGL